MPASSCSAKHRSSRSDEVALTPRMSTPWLRTSRTPTSSAVCAALAVCGGSERGGLGGGGGAAVVLGGGRGVGVVGVDGEFDAAPGGRAGHALHALHHVGGQPVLGQRH